MYLLSCNPNRNPRRRFGLPRTRRGRLHERVRHHPHRSRLQYLVVPLRRQLLFTDAQVRSCDVSTSAGIRFAVRSRFRRRHSSAGVSKLTATQAIPASRARPSHRARRSRSSPKVSIDGRQPPPDPLPDHLFQQRERIGTRRHVVLTGTDQRPQPITRHHQVSREMLRRPRRLPGRPRPDQDHHTRRRQLPFVNSDTKAVSEPPIRSFRMRLFVAVVPPMRLWSI